MKIDLPQPRPILLLNEIKDGDCFSYGMVNYMVILPSFKYEPMEDGTGHKKIPVVNLASGVSFLMDENTIVTPENLKVVRENDKAIIEGYEAAAQKWHDVRKGEI